MNGVVCLSTCAVVHTLPVLLLAHAHTRARAHAWIGGAEALRGAVRTFHESLPQRPPAIKI